jgi:lipopolysaccharide cholinephosphotransferase
MIDYNKSAREQGDTPLKQTHIVMCEIMKVFDAICRKHQLKYWIDAGTLLGAVRHKGFIPWDDDMDICMPREDYQKFMQIAPKELPDGLFFQTRETDPTTKWRWIKIRDNYSTLIQKTELNRQIKYHQGIYIDIFPYDLVDKDFHRSKIFINRKYQRSRQALLRKFSWLVNQAATIPVKIIGHSRLKNFFLNQHSSKTPKLVTTGIEVTVGYHTFDYHVVFPLSEIEFENYRFMAPRDPHQYLTIMFGNYMQLPPEDQRKVHAAEIRPFEKCNHPKAKNY